MSDMTQLRKRYEKLNGARPADKSYIQDLQAEIDVALPADFVSAMEFFDGSGFAVLPLHAVARQPLANVLSETNRIRKAIGLPRQYLVLGEPPESLVVMDCDGGGKVIWCDAIDAKRLGKEQLSRQPEMWESFGEFLEYLLDEEEQDRESKGESKGLRL